MTAFLFSAVMIDGLDSTLTLLSVASALMAARNSPAATVKELNPDAGPAEGKKLNPDAAPAKVVIPNGGMRSRGRDGRNAPASVAGGVVRLPEKRPCWIAHCSPSRVVSSSVTSAASTSIRT